MLCHIRVEIDSFKPKSASHRCPPKLHLTLINPTVVVILEPFVQNFVQFFQQIVKLFKEAEMIKLIQNGFEKLLADTFCVRWSSFRFRLFNLLKIVCYKLTSIKQSCHCIESRQETTRFLVSQYSCASVSLLNPHSIINLFFYRRLVAANSRYGLRGPCSLPLVYRYWFWWGSSFSVLL